MGVDPRAQLEQALHDRYRLERELGAGGMATVYLAHDLKHDRPVAIKVMREDIAESLGKERFLREIKMAARVQHPHVLPLYDSGIAGDALYYVMPFVDGPSLRQWIAGGARLPLTNAIRILRDTAYALAEAHSHGIVHRDLKPENILLTGQSAVVADFGVAKALSAATTIEPGGTLTRAGGAIGTPAYMAPEQAAGDTIDERADLYAWGLIAYELLSGAHPFGGKTSAQALLSAQLAEKPQPLGQGSPDVPASITALVMKCLEKDPAARPQTANDLLHTLESVATPSGERPGVGHGDNSQSRRVRFAWIGGATLALLAMAFIVRRANTPATPPHPRIAVLSFENVSGDTAVEYFADGISDEVSDMLQRMPQLTVVSRLSAKTFKGTKATPAEIGAKLGVEYLLDGSVRRSGNKMRVNVHLVSVATGAAVGAPLSYDRNVTDAVAVQEEIAIAVAQELQVQFPNRAAMSPGRPPKDPAAYDLVLQANQLVRRPEETSLRSALALYKRAIALDSNYARAWGGVGLAWWGLADVYVRSSVAYDSGQQAATIAIRKDSTLALGYALLGHAQWVLAHDWGGAERSFRRAMELEPRSPDVLFMNSIFLVGVGRTEEALSQADLGVALDPLSLFNSWWKETLYYEARRWDDVLAQHKHTERLGPPFDYWEITYAAALREKGRYAEAIAAYDSAEARTHRPWHGLAVTYARMGRTANARRVIAKLEALTKREHVLPDALAMAYASLGDVPNAIRWLEQALEQKSSGVWNLRSTEYDPIREDPRFQDILKRSGLPMVKP